MKILAIDPGNKQSAFVVWDGQNILDNMQYTSMISYKGEEMLRNLFDNDVFLAWMMVGLVFFVWTYVLWRY